MKKALSVFLILLCVLLLTAAHADRAPWTCPSCGTEGNTGNFCGECGAKAPDPFWTCANCGQEGNDSKFCPQCGAKAPDSFVPQSQAPAPVITEAPRPVPTATPTPTATPAPARTFELSSKISTNLGRVTVTWVDSDSNAPYKVLAQYQGDPNVRQPNYIEGEDLYTTSFTLEDLLPGRTYTVEVRDCYGISTKRTYTLPEAATFEDGKLKAKSIKVSIEPRRKESNQEFKEAKKINGLVANDIINNMDSYDYGFRYQVKNPNLAYSRYFFTQVAVIAPNGFTEVELYSDYDFGRDYSGRYWYLLGDTAFDMIYKMNSAIPSGQWTVELYWDGMLVNQSTFNVK